MAHSFIEDLSEVRFTDATIRRMYELADAGKTDEQFQKIIYGIVNRSMHGQWKNYRSELETIFNWFKRKHDYRRDPHNVELVQDVWATMDRGRFDCDDSCIFLCAAAEILGAPCRFVTVSTRRDGEPSHVYLEAFVNDRWEPMDASVQYSTFGWGPTSGITNKKIWSRNDVGLSGYEERPHVDGLGMHYLPNSNPGGWTDEGGTSGKQESDWEGGFASGRRRVKPEGIPDDVSNTFAPGMPGNQVSTERTLPSELVNSVADDRKTYRSDDPTRQYPQEWPINSSPSPTELDYTLPRNEIPMKFNPDVWNGSIPTWGEDPSFMLPIGAKAEAQYMDYTLAGFVSDHDVDWQYMDDGKIDQQLLGELGDDYAKLSPEQRKAVRKDYKLQHAAARAERRGIHHQHRVEVNQRAIDRQAQNRLMHHIGNDHQEVTSLLGGMGSLIDSAAALAKSIGTMVTGGELPKDTNVINQAIDVGAQVAADKLKAEAAKKAAAAGLIPTGTVLPKLPVPSTGMPGWVVPALAVGAVVVVGYAMSRK